MSETDRDKEWRAKLEELEHYKKQHGHFSVPSNTDLGQWVKKQRAHKGGIAQWKSDALDFIGFEWSAYEANWIANFMELQDFREKHDGNCNPTKSSHTSLHNWVYQQRMKYRDGSLSEDKIEKLNGIDFDWGIHSVRNIKLGQATVGAAAGESMDSEEDSAKDKGERNHQSRELDTTATMGDADGLNASLDDDNDAAEINEAAETERINELQAVIMESKQLQAEKQRALEASNRQRLALANKLAASNKEKQDLQRQIQQLRAEKETAIETAIDQLRPNKKALEAAKKEILELRINLTAKQTAIEQLKQDQQASETAKKQLTNNLTAKQKLIDQLQSDNQTLEATRQQEATDNLSARQKLLDQLQTKKHEAKVAWRILDDARAKHEDSNQKYQKVNDDLRKENEASETKAKHLQDHLDDTLKRLEKSNQQNRKLAKQLRDKKKRASWEASDSEESEPTRESTDDIKLSQLNLAQLKQLLKDSGNNNSNNKNNRDHLDDDASPPRKRRKPNSYGRDERDATTKEDLQREIRELKLQNQLNALQNRLGALERRTDGLEGELAHSNVAIKRNRSKITANKNDICALKTWAHQFRRLPPVGGSRGRNANAAIRRRRIAEYSDYDSASDSD